MAQLQSKLEEYERQLKSKDAALAILKNARRAQEANLARQVEIIESLETQLHSIRVMRHHVATPSPPQVDDETRIRRRKAREELYRQPIGRSSTFSVFDYHSGSRRRPGGSKVLA